MEGASVDPAETAAARLGTIILGYRLQAVLGVGGTATVYRGAREGGEVAAIKVLHPWLNADPRARKRFLREASVANRVRHPAMVRMLADGEDPEGTAYLVMELADGQTVEARRVEAGGRLPLEDVVRLAEELLAALAAAHAQGVVHRDIKPSNLMIGADGALRVLDFGIARITDLTETPSLVTRTGAVLGTVLFMAPEQALGMRDDIDARSDVWAVGATMFTLLTGQFVHRARTVNEALVLAATQSARPIRSLMREVPPPVAAVIDRALSFDRNERHADGAAMRAALRRAVSGEADAADLAAAETIPDTSIATTVPFTGRVSPVAARPSRRVARLGRKAAAALIGVTLLTGAFVFAFRTWQKSDPVPASGSAIGAATPRPTAITDLPLPVSSNPQAVAAYAAALQAMHDANWDRARERLEEAVTLDPSLSAAHLRLALANFGEPIEGRPSHARAVEGRAALSDRDKALLAALEPLFREPRDVDASAALLRRAAETYPFDAELFSLYASVEADPKLALDANRHAVDLDPSYAGAWQGVASDLRNLHREQDALEALDRCIAISPTSIDCRQDRVELEIYQGRFGRAEALARDLGVLIESDSDHARHRVHTGLLVAIATETGREKDAARAVDAYLKRKELWQGEEEDWSTVGLLRVMLHGGMLSKEAFAAQRDAWLSSRSSGPPWSLWFFAYLDRIERPDEAVDALAALPRDAKSLDASPHAPGPESVDFAALPREAKSLDEPSDGIGQLFLLAGKPRDAVAMFGRARAACSRFSVAPRATWYYGQALEQTGDAPGACAAYAAVLERWGAAQPRSVTAEKARARALALRCPPPK